MLTEIADEDCLFRIWGPFPVYHLSVLAHIQTKFEPTHCEGVIAALCLLDGVLPLSERVVAMDDGGDIWLEPGIDVEDGFRFKRGGGHGILETMRWTEGIGVLTSYIDWQ